MAFTRSRVRSPSATNSSNDLAKGPWRQGLSCLVCVLFRSHLGYVLSCRGRSFCPSRGKKKQLLRAEWLRENRLAPIPHWHV